MSRALTCTIAPAIDVVSAEDWRRLFPDLLDSLDMIRLVQDCGVPGFAFHSIVVRQGDRPVLLLPLFETTYRLSTLVDADAQRLVEAVTRHLGRRGSLRLLGVGFVEGEWGQVGIDPVADRVTLDAAWDLALSALEELAQGLGTDVTAFVNFTAESGRMLPLGKLNGFCQIHGLPFAQNRISYTDTHAYIASLSKKMRSNLRQKLRKAQGVEVLRTRQPGPWLDAVYQWYLDAYWRSDVQFSVHSREYFKLICQRAADAEYVLYFIGERLVAFQLQVVRPDRLICKYFGMDPDVGRTYSLYFVSWVKDIEYCIAHRIPLYYAGPTEEETKARFGVQFLSSCILFKHRYPLYQGLLATLAKYLAYRPAVSTPPVRLGSDWEEARVPAQATYAVPAYRAEHV